MNLPTTATALSPEEWLRVMSLIHPDNVNETLRILHAHRRLLAAVENLAKLRSAHQLRVPQDVLDLLNNEPHHQHPWPIEPQVEEPLQPEQA